MMEKEKKEFNLTFNYRYYKRRWNNGHQWSNCVRSGYDVSGECPTGGTAIEHDDEVRRYMLCLYKY